MWGGSTSVGSNAIQLATAAGDEVIYRDYLPDALASGRYVAAPRPSAAGHGVQDFQHAMDVQLKGVSAAKVVVTLP